MLKRNPSRSVSWLAASGLVLVTLVVSAGCLTTGTSLNDLLDQLIEESGIANSAVSVTIRVVNNSDALTEELDVRVDGVTTTISCDPDQGVCDLVLAEVPALIEAIEERRYDEEDDYQGGRVFEGQAEFAFTSEDYSTGSIVVYRLSAESAEAFVL